MEKTNCTTGVQEIGYDELSKMRMCAVFLGEPAVTEMLRVIESHLVVTRQRDLLLAEKDKR